MDRQTERILITTPRLHYMQRGKNKLLITQPKSRLSCWQLIYEEKQNKNETKIHQLMCCVFN